MLKATGVAAGVEQGELVVNPAFVCSGTDGKKELRNPYEGTRIQASEPILRIWRTGRVPEDLADRRSLLRSLVEVRFLVPSDMAEIVCEGLTRRSVQPLGAALWSATGSQWAVIGCAADFNAADLAHPAAGMLVVRRALASRLGRNAPADMYSWALRRRVAKPEISVADYGDLIYNEGADSAEQLHAKVAFAVRQVLEAGVRPLLIGGDHSLSFPAIVAVAERHGSLRVVHLDAHADRRRPIAERRTAHCGDFVGWVRARVPDTKVMTIGVRGFDTHFDDTIADAGVTYITADEAAESSVLERLRGFCGTGPTYLTLDIDVVDPTFAPEVAYPSVGGLTHTQVATIVGTVSRETDLVAADFVEVCDSPTTANAAASRQADFILTTLLARR